MKRKILKYKILIPSIAISLIGFGLLYAYFFPKLPKESDLISVKGIVSKISISNSIRTGYKGFYLEGFQNRFEDDYLSKKKFKLFIRQGDRVTIKIVGRSSFNVYPIKIWELEINGRTVYTAQQEIKREQSYKSILPLFAAACLILSIALYKYQLKGYHKSLAHHLSQHRQ